MLVSPLEIPIDVIFGNVTLVIVIAVPVPAELYGVTMYV